MYRFRFEYLHFLSGNKIESKRVQICDQQTNITGAIQLSVSGPSVRD